MHQYLHGSSKTTGTCAQPNLMWHHPGYEIHDGRDENRQGWVLYRTPRGRVVARYATQWANVADRWTADPMEVAQIIASEGIDLDDRDRTILEVLEEVE